MAYCLSHTIPCADYAAPQQGLSYCQPIKVIQLEEVEAPPPMPHRSSSSSASVPLTSAYSDSYDSEDDYEDEESESEEDESECSSYCSSDAEDMQERNIAVYDDTYGTRLSRVLAWRDNFAKATGILPDDSEYPYVLFCCHIQHVTHFHSEPSPQPSFYPTRRTP